MHLDFVDGSICAIANMLTLINAPKQFRHRKGHIFTITKDRNLDREVPYP